MSNKQVFVKILLIFLPKISGCSADVYLWSLMFPRVLSAQDSRFVCGLLAIWSRVKLAVPPTLTAKANNSQATKTHSSTRQYDCTLSYLWLRVQYVFPLVSMVSVRRNDETSLLSWRRWSKGKYGLYIMLGSPSEWWLAWQTFVVLIYNGRSVLRY